MSNVEILGRPRYRPVKSIFHEDPAKFYAGIQSELIKGKPRNFTDFQDLVYERFIDDQNYDEDNSKD